MKSNKKWANAYLSSVKGKAETGDSNESSYYPTLERLLEHFFPRNPKNINKDFVVISNPSTGTRAEGIPDIGINLGGKYIVKFEAKAFMKRTVNVKKWLENPRMNADSKYLHEEVYKYRKDGAVVVITDFLSFWIVDPNSPNIDPTMDDKYSRIKILEPVTSFCEITGRNASTLKLNNNFNDNIDALVNLLYILSDIEIDSAELLRKRIIPFVKAEKTGYRYNFHEEINKILNHPSNLEERKFGEYLKTLNEQLEKAIFRGTKRGRELQLVDLYTQLLVFGIFMGWIRFNSFGDSEASEGEFTIEDLASKLPMGTFIRDLLRLHKVPKQIKINILKPIEKTFQLANYNKIISKIDEILGVFYSDFLHEYDKKLADNMGIVYTPQPIIDFIIRGIEHFLINKFNIEKGILDKEIFYLDPAAGTMGFPASLMHYAHEKLENEIRNSSKYEGESEESINNQLKHDFNEWVFAIPAQFPTFVKTDEDKENYSVSQPLFMENVFAFEILLAPYVLGYSRMLIEAHDLGAKVKFGEHYPQLYLNNTLIEYQKNEEFQDEIDPELTDHALRKEVEMGLKIREKGRIFVIMGNPPYNISSQNKTIWIKEKLQNYKLKNNRQRESGKPLFKELKGLRAIEDDYIKFMRFAHWKIAEQNKKGIIGFVTNNFYLDGLVARGMRKILRKDFDEIWVLNLHGDARLGMPDIIKEKLKKIKLNADENVFGVKVGIAIVFLVRYPLKNHDDTKCLIKYAEKWGKKGNIKEDTDESELVEGEQDQENSDNSDRDLLDLKTSKFDFLRNNNINTIDFVTLPELSDETKESKIYVDYEFIPLETGEVFYNYLYHCPYLPVIFKKNISGLVTGHDNEVIATSKNILEEKLERFFTKYSTSPPNRPKALWNPQNILGTDLETAKSKIQILVWRGFEQRYISYDEGIIARTRASILPFITDIKDNYALILDRGTQNIGNSYFAITSDKLIDHKACSGASGKGSYAFPLKINNFIKKEGSDEMIAIETYNISPEFLELLPYKEKDGETEQDVLITNPEEVYQYIYGMLFCKQYLIDFRQFLKKDFPHVPFPKSIGLFEEMAKKGKFLVELHLFDETKFRYADCSYNESITDEEDRKILEIRYDKDAQRVYFKRIPAAGSPESVMWIGNIDEETWNFQIGGKKQIKSWLENRIFNDDRFQANKLDHGLKMNDDELKYLRKMVSVIKNTIKIQKELDEIYQKILKDVFLFELADLNRIFRINSKKSPSNAIMDRFL